ncbi:MAG: Uma2 family endonuclease [Sphingomonadaceae bacterium]|nr:Uma2 family endonuclease [Sphingomonadaceae bacterium]
MLARANRRMTVDQFLKLYEGTEGKYELVNGQVYAMAGGTATHADVCGNIFAALRQKLRGSGCRPFNSDMGLTLTDESLRYPDVAVYCDPRDLQRNLREVRSFRFPKLIVEVLSPSTAEEDIGEKLLAYKRIDTVQAVVIVDPVDQTLELHERVAPDEWRHRILPPESGLSLRDPAVELGFHEIFASD